MHNGDVIGTGVLHTKAFKATAKVGDIEADYICDDFLVDCNDG